MSILRSSGFIQFQGKQEHITSKTNVKFLHSLINFLFFLWLIIINIPCVAFSWKGSCLQFGSDTASGGDSENLSMEKLIIISVKELYPGLFQCQYFVPELVINNVGIITETKKGYCWLTCEWKVLVITISGYSLGTFVEWWFLWIWCTPTKKIILLQKSSGGELYTE